uniref:MICOS complex subunit n=1 Tax=Mesocestoides corti TaxID=53468 RepID=A0A5K3F7T0_MESCO
CNGQKIGTSSNATHIQYANGPINQGAVFDLTSVSYSPALLYATMKAADLPIYNCPIDDDKAYVLEPIPDSAVRTWLLNIISPARRSVVNWYGTAETNTQKSVKFVLEKSMGL